MNAQPRKDNENHPKNKRSPPVFGSKKVPNNTGIAGGRIIRNAHFFVGGLSNEMDPSTLAEHIKSSIGIVEVSLNRRNFYNSSFKVTIQNTDKEKFFCAEAWEENIILKPFREQRRQHQGQRNDENEAPRQQRQFVDENEHHQRRSIDWGGINQRLYDASKSPSGSRIFY